MTPEENDEYWRREKRREFWNKVWADVFWVVVLVLFVLWWGSTSLDGGWY